MEYGQEGSGAAGSIPEFGAIFMSSIVTKKECFKRKIFGLPSSKAEFVKHVKAGMILFLFEFEKRQLYGVYQASSDGAMDIVPHAFSYSGKRFPAQVCFMPIWYCDPLSEKEFRDAIIENYFSTKKFNFGLSEDQVHRLLYMFSSRKLRNKMPPFLLSEAVGGVDFEDIGQVNDDGYLLSEREDFEATGYDEFKPAVSGDYLVNSLDRAKENEFSIDDGGNAGGKSYSLAQGDLLAKRRRIDNDDKLITNNFTENEIYNGGTLRTFLIDSLKDSLDGMRRLDDAHQLLRVERVLDENKVDEILNPVVSSGYLTGPLDVQTTDDYQFMRGYKFSAECNLENGSGREFANECYGKPLDKSRHQPGRLLSNNYVQREQTACEAIVYGDGTLNLPRQAREVIANPQCFVNGKLENRYHLDHRGSPVGSFEPSTSLLHNTRKTTTVGNFPVNYRIPGEPKFITSAAEDFSSESSAYPLHHGQLLIHDRRYPSLEGRVTENVDGILCSAASTRNARYFRGVDGRVIDDGLFRKSQRMDNEEDIHTLISPVFSMEYPSFSKQKQNLSPIGDKLPDKGPSRLSIDHNFDWSRPMFEDATITRAVPYVTEHPNFPHGSSASMVTVNQNTNIMQENHYCHGSVECLYSSRTLSSPYFPDSRVSTRSPDTAPKCEDNALQANKSSQQSSLLHETSGSFLNSSVSMQTFLNTSNPVNYSGSSLSKFPLTPLPSSVRRNIEGGKEYLAYPSKSTENHFALDGNLTSDLTPLPSSVRRNIERGKEYLAYPSKSTENHFALDGNLTSELRASGHVPRQQMDMLVGKNLISGAKGFSVGAYHLERDLASHEHHKNCEAPFLEFKCKRRSVFTRLTSRQGSQVGEGGNGCDFDYHSEYMDASADEVKEMLQLGNNFSLKKPRKFRVVGKSKQEETAIGGKQIQVHTEKSHSGTEKKRPNDAQLAIEESHDEVPKETRTVDFKRRNDTKKNMLGTNNDSTADNDNAGVNEEIKSSTTKTLKRKRLVRPVFEKVESASDSICGNQNLRLPVLDKDDEQSCDKAASVCEGAMPNDKTGLSNVLVSYNHESLGMNTEEHSNPEEQKDKGAHELPSTSHKLEGHKTRTVGLQVDGSKVFKEAPQR